MNINILVVEDDTIIQDMVCKFLRNEGFVMDNNLINNGSRNQASQRINIFRGD